MTAFKVKEIKEHDTISVGVYKRDSSTDPLRDEVEYVVNINTHTKDTHLLESVPIPVAGIQPRVFANLIRKISDDLAIQLYSNHNSKPGLTLISVIMPNVITVACTFTPDSFNLEEELEKLLNET